MLQINKLESAKSLIIELGDIRETYGYWMRNMNLISMYFDKQYLPNSKDFIVKAMQEMGDICIKFNPKYKSYIQSFSTPSFFFLYSRYLDRTERPLACRIFPLFPIVYEEDGKTKIKVIRDPRATMCPIVRSSKRVDPSFVRQVRMAARYLIRDEKILDYMKNVSLELLEIIELQARLEEGED